MDDEERSVDDALEETRDNPVEHVGDNPLPEDNDTPAAPPRRSDDLPDDHQLTDVNIENSELYDEGINGATEVDANNEDERI